METTACHAQQRERFALREAWGSTAPASRARLLQHPEMGLPFISFGVSPTIGFPTVNAKAAASNTSTVWERRCRHCEC